MFIIPYRATHHREAVRIDLSQLQIVACRACILSSYARNSRIYTQIVVDSQISLENQSGRTRTNDLPNSNSYITSHDSISGTLVGLPVPSFHPFVSFLGIFSTRDHVRAYRVFVAAARRYERTANLQQPSTHTHLNRKTSSMSVGHLRFFNLNEET